LTKGSKQDTLINGVLAITPSPHNMAERIGLQPILPAPNAKENSC